MKAAFLYNANDLRLEETEKPSINDDEILVKVNHVMEKEHFIEWISLVADNKEYFIKLYPEQNAECRFPYIPGSVLYAYCNKHGLWKKELEYNL